VGVIRCNERKLFVNSANPGVAVVGCGYWGRNLVRNFHALGALRVVCDSDEQLLSALRSQYPKVKAASSLADVLADPDVQAVAIATPASLHAALGKQVLLAGKGALIEKPLALTEAEGESLVQLAEQQKQVLMVGHLLWYHPAVLKLKELVDQGELGRLQYIYSQRLNLGRIRREENILWSFAPHDISVILGLVGEEPERVQAQGGYYLHQQIADVTVSCLAFPSGVGAHIFVSWLHPYKEQRLVVVGDRKMAVFNDLEEHDKLLLYPHTIEWRGNMPVPNPREAKRVPLDWEEPLQAECAHFLECVANSGRPRTDGHEALRVLRVLQQCQGALETGRDRSHSQAGPHARPPQDFFVHPTATVDDGVEIGAGTRIWHHSHIMPKARIGQNCSLGGNVFVGREVTIGNNVKIQNNVSVYESVTLEDGVFCGPSMVFTNVINPRSEIERKDEFRPTLVKQGATLGANCTVVCGATIGQYAFIGAGAVVVKDVPNFALVIGNPGRIVGWMCRCGNRIDFNGNAELGSCRECRWTYRKVGDEVVPQSSS
jgi:UDP-2-acetamido-3-amino-2,3-dideoxy-glucuronate N-acetyltransferase